MRIAVLIIGLVLSVIRPGVRSLQPLFVRACASNHRLWFPPCSASTLLRGRTRRSSQRGCAARPARRCRGSQRRGRCGHGEAGSPPRRGTDVTDPSRLRGRWTPPTAIALVTFGFMLIRSYSTGAHRDFAA